MIVSHISYQEGDSMSVVSPKTIKAREDVTAILVKHTCGILSMSQAEHELWKIVNGLLDNYDQGFSAGYRKAEEEYLMRQQQKREPKYREVDPADHHWGSPDSRQGRVIRRHRGNE